VDTRSGRGEHVDVPVGAVEGCGRGTSSLTLRNAWYSYEGLCRTSPSGRPARGGETRERGCCRTSVLCTSHRFYLALPQQCTHRWNEGATYLDLARKGQLQAYQQEHISE
jgi:hypothetical protein